MLENFDIFPENRLLFEVQKLKAQGYRLAAVTCEQIGNSIKLTYHFDLNYVMKNLRIIVGKTEPLHSISPIYSSAFLIENEFQDLYGITFEGLILDYKGRLYLTEDSPTAPMLTKKS